MLASSRTYDITKESDLILLPSKHTLCDYTHWLKLKSGFNGNVADFLRNEIKLDTLPKWKSTLMFNNFMSHLIYCSPVWRPRFIRHSTFGKSSTEGH